MSIPLRTIPCLLAAIGIASVALAQDRPRFPSGRTPPVQNARIATTGYTLIEAEALVSGAVASTGGVSAQPMAGFGPNWSGNSQLFWAPAASNPRDPATLKVTFNVPSPGDYSLRLAYTKAPDYGDLQLYVAGRLDRELNGYAPNVQRSVTTLADQHFDSGPNELMLKVFRKNAQSRGYFAGLDSIELLLIKSGTNRVTQTQTAGGGQSTAQQQPGGPIVGFSAKLAFATFDAKLNFDALGVTEGDFYESDIALDLAYETTAQSYQWRWQVATQPFPKEAALSAPGLIAQGPAAKSPFTIDLSHVPPFGKPPTGLQSAQGGGNPQPTSASANKPGPMTLYVRLVPLKDNAITGPPSNSVIAHYKTGDSPAQQGVTAAMQTEAMKQAMLGYSVEIEKYEPAKFPNEIGCIVVVKNPYTEVPLHTLAQYKVGEKFCPKKKDDEPDALDWVGEAFKGWFLAGELAADYYNSAKGWIAMTIVEELIPCEALGDDFEGTCEGAFNVIVESAITAAMASAGVPPTMPSLSQLAAAAEGDLLDAAVDFTCDQVKGEGVSECDALLEEGLRKLYEEGLEQLKEAAKRGAQEPDCGVESSSHHAMPCFTDYPDTEVKPTPRAIYIPPFVHVKVTRTKPVPSPYLACNATLTMHAKNHFSGTGYVNGVKLPAKDIAGELYAPAVTAIPLLDQGESVTLKVAFQEFRLFSISANSSAKNGTLGEWAELYWSGNGAISLTTDGPLPSKLSSGRAPCSAQASMALTLPSKNQ